VDEDTNVSKKNDDLPNKIHKITPEDQLRFAEADKS
jgi:hypothetical protein